MKSSEAMYNSSNELSETQQQLFDAIDASLPGDFPLQSSDSDYVSAGGTKGAMIRGYGHDGSETSTRGIVTLSDGESVDISSRSVKGDNSRRNRKMNKIGSDDYVMRPLNDTNGTGIKIVSDTPTARIERQGFASTEEDSRGDIVNQVSSASVHKTSTGEHLERKGGMEPTVYEAHISKERQARYTALLAKLALKKILNAENKLRISGEPKHIEAIKPNYDD